MHCGPQKCLHKSLVGRHACNVENTVYTTEYIIPSFDFICQRSVSKLQKWLFHWICFCKIKFCCCNKKTTKFATQFPVFFSFITYLSVKLRCDERFTHAFTACICVFKVITLAWANQRNFFEMQLHAVNACVKRSSQRSFSRRFAFSLLHTSQIRFCSRNNIIHFFCKIENLCLFNRLWWLFCNFFCLQRKFWL